ncbi:hypothetical protein [Halobacillus ihumii]|uniref:hypothetical protein n=1 Tax=Halobacillus ihumii TaxID=2686092 RepID=UPI0013D2A0BF|nr:hypothetical protein [Halobacillus ihumii]
MNNLDNYLVSDVSQAVRETKCFWKLSDKLNEAFTQGDMENTKKIASDMINTANTLIELRNKKIIEDRKRLEKLAEYKLNAHGIYTASVEVKI